MAGSRLVALDLARTMALAGMVAFHFTRDLEMFGLVAPGLTQTGFWWYFARGIAGSFLALAGFSLFLAHGQGIRWPAFLRRLATILAAAALVTAATWAAMPEAFIFFGILHSIAVASVLGLLFLRLPFPLTWAAAILVWMAPGWLGSPVFDAPWLVWTGLGTYLPRTLDFEPVFPWFAPFLAGLGLAQLLTRTGGLARWQAAQRQSPLAKALAWPGRHSLAIYLIHQPLLYGLLWLVAG